MLAGPESSSRGLRCLLGPPTGVCLGWDNSGGSRDEGLKTQSHMACTFDLPTTFLESCLENG